MTNDQWSYSTQLGQLALLPLHRALERPKRNTLMSFKNMYVIYDNENEYNE